MESATEVRYAGVVVGRGAPLRDRDDAGVFVVFAEPLPVGTPVWLKIEDAERTARVTGVVESADPNLGGMRLRFVAESEAGRSAPKPVAAAPAPARTIAAAPAVEAAPAIADMPVADAAPAAAAAPVADAALAAADAHAAEASGVADAPADPAVAGGAAVPSAVEGDASSAAGSGKRRRKRR